MTGAVSAELQPLVSREQMDNAFHRAINMFVGRGKRHRAADVCTGAGIDRRRLDCYRGYPIGHPDHRPLHEHEKWSISSYVGADLTSQWIQSLGQGAFDIPDDDTPPAMRMACESADDNAKLLNIVADNRIDKDEREDAAAIGRRSISRGVALVSASRAKAA